MSMKPGATTSPLASTKRSVRALRSAACGAHRDDAIAADADVAVEVGVPGAVDDLAVANDDVERA